MQRLATLRYRCGDVGDRDPAEGEVKENGCSSQTERAGWWFRAVEEGSKCRAFAEMQGQCTRCRRALGRTREGKKSSSWCWLQLFSAARLVDQWAPLPAFCCAGWLTRPSGHHGHWTSAGALASTGGGIPRAKSKRESANKGWLAAGGLCLGALLFFYAALNAGL